MDPNGTKFFAPDGDWSGKIFTVIFNNTATASSSAAASLSTERKHRSKFNFSFMVYWKLKQFDSYALFDGDSKSSRFDSSCY